jgi:NADH-quinone oxidoreductase subunit N
MLISLLTNLSFYLPELFVIISMTLMLMFETTYKKTDSGRLFLYLVGAVGLLISLFLTMANFDESAKVLFHQAVALDNFSNMAKMLLILGTLGVVYIGYNSKDLDQNTKSEFFILSSGVLVGAMLVVGAMNLLSLYVGIEILSILSYVLASLKKKDALSQEAGLKYSLYGALSAAVMLFGMGHLYGITGSLNFVDIAKGFSSLTPEKMQIAKICLVLIFVGIGFKISAFPFHMWSPDVYQGSPVPVTAFFSIVPKLAVIAALCRITGMILDTNAELFSWWSILIQVVAVLTMTVGNLTALGQSSVKRLLAYSSMGHVGFILMGLSVGNGVGLKASLFYMCIYLFMTLVAFAVVDHVVKIYGSDESSFFKGMVSKNPLATILMTITVFSLAGFPPLGGFVAKFSILNLVIEEKNYLLAVIAALNSVIALFYYLRLTKIMIVDSSLDVGEGQKVSFVKHVYLALMTAPVIVAGLFWNSLYQSTTLLQLLPFKP